MTGNPDWLSWPQAAALVGCPVPTIETYVRAGRIERRPARGPRPSLRRDSVEEFAGWWCDETARRERVWAVRDQRKAARERRRIRPPEPEGWVDTRRAAELVGCRHPDHVLYLARQGRFEARKVGVRWWVREAEVEAYVRERVRWVSWVTAAEIAGCSHETIRRAVQAGRIERRDVHRTQPSLSLESVRTFAEERSNRQT